MGRCGLQRQTPDHQRGAYPHQVKYPELPKATPYTHIVFYTHFRCVNGTTAPESNATGYSIRVECVAMERTLKFLGGVIAPDLYDSEAVSLRDAASIKIPLRLWRKQ